MRNIYFLVDKLKRSDSSPVELEGWTPWPEEDSKIQKYSGQI